MRLRAFGMSDVGRRRESNEDHFLVDAERGLFAVADGMGGHAAGEVASRLAIDALRGFFDAEPGEGADPGDESAVRRLREAVVAANRNICDAISGHEERRGMGTTVVALLADRDRAVIGHVGDSRVYLLRDGRLRRLTSDHSWVNEQVRMGFLTDDAAQRHPMRNIVTRALGSRQDVSVDLAEEPVRPGDVFLLCSDGLNTMLPDDAIEALLRHAAEEPPVACRSLIEEANRRGGEDNVTVVVVAFADGSAASS